MTKQRIKPSNGRAGALASLGFVLLEITCVLHHFQCFSFLHLFHTAQALVSMLSQYEMKPHSQKLAYAFFYIVMETRRAEIIRQ